MNTLFFTFEHETKTSDQAHEHVTIAFHSDGTMTALSREATRSVGRKWDAVGTFSRFLNGSAHFRFTENSIACRMAATALYRAANCQSVEFTTGRFDPSSGEFRLISVLRSNGRTTNPESIKGRIRDRSQDKKRASVQKRFGRMGTVNVAAMRAAIVGRKADRISDAIDKHK